MITFLVKHTQLVYFNFYRLYFENRWRKTHTRFMKWNAAANVHRSHYQSFHCSRFQTQHETIVLKYLTVSSSCADHHIFFFSRDETKYSQKIKMTFLQIFWILNNNKMQSDNLSRDDKIKVTDNKAISDATTHRGQIYGGHEKPHSQWQRAMTFALPAEIP